MSWATAQGSSRKDREKYAEKYTDRKRFRRKFSHLSSVIKFPSRVVLYHVWFDFIWDILGGKTTFKLALLTLIFIMGHENFTHRFNFQKQQSSTVRFIFSLIKILLLKFSPKGIVSFKKISAFFCQIYEASELELFISVHGTVVCNKFQLDFDFYDANFDSLYGL